MNNFGYVITVFMVWLIKHEEIVPWLLEKFRLED